MITASVERGADPVFFGSLLGPASNPDIGLFNEMLYLTESTRVTSVVVRRRYLYPSYVGWVIDMSSLNPIVITGDETPETHPAVLSEIDVVEFLSDEDYNFSIEPNEVIELRPLSEIKQGK